MSYDPDAYHAIAFTSPEEAAGFIAALSRKLGSPEASLDRESPGVVEVLARTTATAVEVYLSGPAFAAAHHAFSPLPESREINRNAIPLDRTLIIDGMNPVAMGMDDVAPRLARG